jgi:Ciliary BBSome complex subunit 2, C-terminal
MSNTMKTHFAANMQENINNLKASIVRAEASHMIDDIDGLRKHYAEVTAENGALIGEY